jgi:hypothetical protein
VVGTATVIVRATVTMEGPLRKLGPGSVVAGAVAGVVAAAASGWGASPVGEASASAPGATAATVGGRSSRCSLPSRRRKGSAATVRQDATIRRARSPCSNLSFRPSLADGHVRDGRANATATRRAARSRGKS